MSQKFGRQYRLTIDPNDGNPDIIITLPFTAHFWMERNTFADLNRFSIDIYNLSTEHRRRIFQDRNDLTTYRTVKFEMGYSNVHQVFFGRIYEANSSREGTNIVTRIEARDGQYDTAATQTNLTIKAGTSLKDVFTTLIGEFPNLTLGAIGNWDLTFNRPLVLNGLTWDLIKKYSDNLAFIDNGKVYILNPTEALAADPVPTIDDSFGLLETPRRDEGFLSITTLLEPTINIGTMVNLQSSINPVYNTGQSFNVGAQGAAPTLIYNGLYQVVGVKHQGTISAAIGGDARSVFSLLHPNFFKYTQVHGQ